MDPIETVVREIERALAAGLHYLAIVMALTLPDICAALESPTGKTSPSQYCKWYKTHLRQKMGRMTAGDCYDLRCGVVHQGRMNAAKGRKHDRVLFTVGQIKAHDATVNGALMYDSERFCEIMVQAVRDWFATAKTNPIVQGNLPNLVRFRENGLAPYTFGVPLIA